jgi:3-hydroxyacyl-[acyl-carrier-protein] dehydratase
MLKDSFFQIKTWQTADNSIKAMVEIDPAHPIFEGHFPGQPVVPGVCMMQMVKEITEQHLGKVTNLVKADQIKFLTILIPGESGQLLMDLKLNPREDGATGVDAQLQNDTAVFFKFKGLFV